MNNNVSEINQNLLNKMYMYIRMEEANNLKIGKYTDQQMVNKIIQIIQLTLKEGTDEISQN